MSSTIAANTASLLSECEALARNAKAASQALALIKTDLKNRWLLKSADALQASAAEIVAANAVDLDAAPGFGLTPAAIDRLALTPDRIASIADGLRQIAALPDPIGELLERTTRPNGLLIEKVRVPLGTVFFIYESRPNVTADAAAICIKSGNAVILRGGKEARHSSQSIVSILQATAASVGIPPAAVQLVGSTDRDAVGHLLKMNQWIDVTIPRGGEGLIRRVAAEATMPVIKHFDGNCHVYVDSNADLETAINIIVNSKCHRMGVCNACESLLIHRNIAELILPAIQTALEPFNVEIRGDSTVCRVLSSAIPATEVDWGAEYLGPIISVKIVESLDEAISHINHFGSHHTDAIVTKDPEVANQFAAAVDSSAVMINASTRFNDGGEFGMGAEIGISTDKFHARGPCGLRELTSYKYIVSGTGQIRK